MYDLNKPNQGSVLLKACKLKAMLTIKGFVITYEWLTSVASQPDGFRTPS